MGAARRDLGATLTEERVGLAELGLVTRPTSPAAQHLSGSTVRDCPRVEGRSPVEPPYVQTLCRRSRVWQVNKRRPGSGSTFAETKEIAVLGLAADAAAQTTARSVVLSATPCGQRLEGERSSRPQG